jgi:hypothetical protein
MSRRKSMPKDKLQKVVLAGIVAAIGVAAMYVFWISPELALLTESRNRIGKLEDELQQIQRRAKLETVNQPMLQQIQAFAEPLRERTVVGDPYMWVVLQMNQLTEQRPVRMPTPRPGARSAHPRVAGYEMLTTVLDVEGTYDAIGMLVRDFENLYPLGEVRSVEFGSLEATGSKRRATIEVRYLIWPEDKLKVKEEPKKKS